MLEPSRTDRNAELQIGEIHIIAKAGYVNSAKTGNAFESSYPLGYGPAS